MQRSKRRTKRVAPIGGDGFRIAICIAGVPVLVYACFLATFSRSGFPSGLAAQGWLPWLADKPVGEDGFYMLTVAWNVASGYGPVAKAGANPTTGIQPLATAVLAAVAWLIRNVGGDKWDFVRAVIVIGGITTVLLSFLLGRVATRLVPAERRNTASFITFSLGVGSSFLFRLCTYGLETGIYLIMVSFVVFRSLASPPVVQRGRSAVALGVLVGLTALARIDFSIIFAVVAVALLMSGRVSLRWVATCGLAASLIVAPWLVWMYLVSGSPLPSSGLAQSGVATGPILLGRLARMASALIQDVTPWSHTEGRLPLTLLTLGEWALVGAVLVCRRRRLPGLLSPAIGRIALAWLAGVTALIPIYTVLFWSSHFYSRYMAPLAVLAFPAIGSGLAGLFAPYRARRYVALVYVGMLASFFLHAATSLHTGHIGNTHVLAAGFVQRHFSGQRVGAFQSGVIGYFNDNVLNLDGKVNGDALRARRTRTLADYLDRARVDVLIDWPEVLRANLNAAYLQNRWVPCETQPPLDQSLCLRRMPAIE